MMYSGVKVLVSGAAAKASVAAVGLAALLWSAAGNAAELMWTGDFETGDYSQFLDHMERFGTHTTRKIVKSPVRAGRYATELVILGVGTGSSSSERAEIMSRDPKTKKNVKFEWDGPEYWVGFSFMFKEWDANAYTFFQIHAPNEPKGDPCDMAGNTFTIRDDGSEQNGGISNKLAIHVIENGGVSAGGGAGSNNRKVYTYPFPINEWQDYVVNFRLSTRGEGFYHVWKNGKKVYSKTGLTNVNFKDSCGNRIPSEQARHNGLHIGLYSPGEPSFYQRIFYDELRVAQGANGYDLVAPGGGKAAAPEDDVPAVPKPPVITSQNP